MAPQFSGTPSPKEVPGPVFLGLGRALITLLLLVVPWSLGVVGYVGTALSLLGWIAFAMWVWRREPRQSDPQARWAIAWALGGVFYALLHLAQLTSLSEARQLEASSRLLALSGIVFVPWLGRMSWRDFALPLALSGLCFGGIALLHPVAADPDHRVFGFYSFANMMGFAPMILGLILASVLPHVSQWMKLLLILGLLGTVTATFQSGTRGAWPGMLALLAVLWRNYRVWHQHTGATSNWKRRVMALLAVLLVLCAGLPSARIRWASTWADIVRIHEGDQGGSIGARLALAKLAVGMIEQQPLRGNGLSEFHRRVQNWADARNLPLHASERGFENPHNQYLDWAQALGLPAAAACVFVLLVLPHLIGRRSGGEAKTVMLCVSTSVPIFLLSEAIVDRHHGAQWFALVYGLAVGMCLTSRCRRCFK